MAVDSSLVISGAKRPVGDVADKSFCACLLVEATGSDVMVSQCEWVTTENEVVPGGSMRCSHAKEAHRVASRDSMSD